MYTLGIKMAFLLLTLFQSTYAQQDPLTLPLTLDKARGIAIDASPTLQSSQINVLLAEEQIKQAKNRAIPEVTADFNLQHNLIIPQTPVPAKAFNPNAQDGELLLLRFSTKWTGNAGVNLNYDLYDPTQRSQVKQSRIKSTIASIDLDLARKEVILNTSNAYIEALIAQEQLKLNQVDTKNKTTIFQMLSDQYNEGRISLIDLNNGKAALNTAISKNREAKIIAEKANAKLLYNLGYNPMNFVEIIFQDNIEVLFENYNFQISQNGYFLDLKKLEQEKLLLEEQKFEAKMNYYPKLTLGAFYGDNYFDNQLDIFQNTNWHGNSYVKVGLKIPLSDWFKYKNDKAIVNYQINSSDLAYKDMQNLSALNYLTAQKDIEFNKSKYDDIKRNFLLEQENSALIQQQFEEGRILIQDLTIANYAVEVAKNDYLNAAYDYLLAQLQMEQLKEN